MHSNRRKLLVLLLVAGAAVGTVILVRPFGFPKLRAATLGTDRSDDQPDLLQAFAAVEPIDTHVHAFKTDPEISDLLAHLQLNVLDICVADNHGIYGQLETQIARAKAFIQASHSHARLCVTFDPFGFGQKDFARKTTAQLRREFAQGADAVKIWK